MALWHTVNSDESLGKILSDLVKHVQTSAKKLEEKSKELKQKLQKMHVELTDEQFSVCAPVLFKMVDDQASENDIKKTIEQLTKQIKESMEK